MNRRLRGSAACLLVMGMWGAVAQAQPAAGGGAGAGPIPPALITTPDQAQIDAWSKAATGDLLNEADPALQGKARDNMVNACFVKRDTPAGAGFLAMYSASLNNEFWPKLAPGTKLTPRQRLNLAIVTAKVASVAQQSPLAPTVERLINDPLEPVVLWGLKGAQPIAPAVVKLRGAGNNPLHPMLAAVRPAALKHPSGPVFEEAYAALGNATTVSPDNPVLERAVKAAAAEMISLWENRLQQYRSAIPEDPIADGMPVFFLTTRDAWNTIVKDQATRTQVMQMVSDQLSLASQHADASKDREKRDQLVKLSIKCAGACAVVGTHQSNDPLKRTAGDEMNRMQPAVQNVGIKIRPMADAVGDELRRAYPGVKPPAPPAAGVAQP
ncbi:MAG TPA: hypothetical protein VEA69_04265 [Tepidisphaeraceae bacterium]|nr:hypothetical protein [Tepidisphaeraceae bacterium]